MPVLNNRDFSIAYFFARTTYEPHVLLADAAYDAHVVKQVRGEAANAMRVAADDVLVLPPPRPLPQYVFMAHLQSTPTPRDTERNHLSLLVLVWFGDDLDVTPWQAIEPHLREIDWDEHAVNWTY
jgi:hypothetical protein